MQEMINIGQMISDTAVDFARESVATPALIQERRKRILQLEQHMMNIPNSYGMAEFNPGKVTHHFGEGVYGRELFIPAGNIIVSKIHRGKTFNVIAKGKISVIDAVKGFNTYEGPFCFVSEPMTKRIVIAQTDTLWITNHENANNSQDLDEIESRIIAPAFQDEE